MCNKVVKGVLKGLQQYADPPSSFSIRYRKHLRVSWEMLNDKNNRVKVMVTLPVTPSDVKWIYQHLIQVKKRFRELGISTEVTHI